MGKLTGAGLAGIGKGIGVGLKAGFDSALAGGSLAVKMLVKSIGKAAEREDSRGVELARAFSQIQVV